MRYLRLKGIGYKENYILSIKMLRYFGEKLFHHTIEPDTSSGFTTLKFVAIAGSISLILFGLGYMFHGLGSSLKPISDIVEELHDSDKSEISADQKEIENMNEVNSEDAEESNSEE